MVSYLIGKEESISEGGPMRWILLLPICECWWELWPVEGTCSVVNAPNYGDGLIPTVFALVEMFGLPEVVLGW